MYKLYHHLMSEVYYTRAFMWMMFALTTFVICEHPANVISLVIDLVISAGYLIRSYMENRRAK